MISFSDIIIQALSTIELTQNRLKGYIDRVIQKNLWILLFPYFWTDSAST